jgi:hypothetical protein
VSKKTSKTSSTTSLPGWAQGLAQGAANTINNTVQANQPNLQHISDSISGQLPGLSAAAFGPNPGLDAANGYAQDVLGGKFLNSNPYTDQMVQQGEQDAGNAVNSAFSRAGRTGGGNNISSLARGVAQAGDAIRFGQYNQERANQQQAAGMLPSLAAAKFAGVPAYLSAAQAAGTMPLAGLGPLASMGSLWSGQGTTTQTQPGGWGNQLLGAAASALPFILSERSKKTKIKLLRREPDGLGIYEFAYKTEPETMRQGPMADEVEALRPWALGPRLADGSRTVNYAKLGEAA